MQGCRRQCPEQPPGYAWRGSAGALALGQNAAEDGPAQLLWVLLGGLGAAIEQRRVLMVALAPQAELSEDLGGRAQEPGRLAGGALNAVGPARDKAVAALVGNRLGDPGFGTECPHHRFAPAGCAGRVLMQEVAPGGKLQPIDLDRESEQCAAFGDLAPDLVWVHATVVPACRAASQ